MCILFESSWCSVQALVLAGIDQSAVHHRQLLANLYFEDLTKVYKWRRALWLVAFRA